MIRPPALREGDRIAVVAPASPFDREEFDRGLEELRSLGLEPVFNDSVFERSDYLAGSASERARNFVEAWRDPSIAAVMAVRGGYGSAQLLPFLNASDCRTNPKVLIGCSDITSLLSFASIQCEMTVFHGPMVVTLGKGERLYDRTSLIGQIMAGAPYGSLVCDGIDDQVVRDQFAAFHDRFDFPAQFGFLGHRTTQDLAARDLWYTILLSHQSGLGPFPGTGCSQQNYSHHSTPNFSYLVDLKAYPFPNAGSLNVPTPEKSGRLL